MEEYEKGIVGGMIEGKKTIRIMYGTLGEGRENRRYEENSDIEENVL